MARHQAEQIVEKHFPIGQSLLRHQEIHHGTEHRWGRAVGQIGARSRKVLEFAQERATKVTDWIALSNDLFSPSGLATKLFPTEPDRRAFLRSKEYKRILAMMNKLPYPSINGDTEIMDDSIGTLVLNLPRSVMTALLAEAKEQGMSWSLLCLSKLAEKLHVTV